MDQRVKNRTLVTALIGSLLISCGENASQDTSLPKINMGSKSDRLHSLASTNGSPIQSFQATVRVTTTTTVAGAPVQTVISPANETVAFMFYSVLGFTFVKLRVDIPGSVFPDGIARIVTYNQGNNTAHFINASTYAADSNVSPQDIANVVQNYANLALKYVNPSNPFAKLTPTQFQQQSQSDNESYSSSGGGISQQGVTMASATRSSSPTSSSTETTKRSFDPGVGAVTQLHTDLSDSQSTKSADTTISYTGVQGLPSVTIPYQISSNEDVSLKNGYGTANIKEQINYDNISLNSLSSSYFDVGGN